MGRGLKWDAKDDIALVKAWVNVVGNPIDGVSLKGDKLWENIRVDYETNAGSVKRNGEGLRGRFKKVNREIQKFHGLYLSSNNSVSDAEKWYKEASSKKKAFQYTESWQILKDCPRWKLIEEADGEKRESKMSPIPRYADTPGSEDESPSSVPPTERAPKRKRLEMERMEQISSNGQLESIRLVREEIARNTRVLKETKELLCTRNELSKRQLELEFISLLAEDDPDRQKFIADMKKVFSYTVN